MQQDLPSNEMMLLSIYFAVYAPYARNSSKKCKIRKHFKLVLNSTNVYLKKTHYSQIKLDGFSFQVSNSKFGNPMV